MPLYCYAVNFGSVPLFVESTFFFYRDKKEKQIVFDVVNRGHVCVRVCMCACVLA